MKLLITGAQGFIGSAFVRHALDAGHACSGIDAMARGSHPANLVGLEARCHQANILDAKALERIFKLEQPDALIHFAAESHVDRSISDPCAFVETNALGSARLLEASRAWWQSLPPTTRETYRHIQVSTDEVFGQLTIDGPAFDESSPLAPRSPYSASKAAADLMALAWRETYGLPTIVTRCSNNYGPRQFPEKLIPKTILSAMAGLPISLYGDGTQIRDWLHVDDHCRAIMAALQFAQPGSHYAIGGGTELSNAQVIHAICELVDEQMNRRSGTSHALVQRVADRPGHDFRYAIDSGKANRDLGWSPLVEFKAGLSQTVQWYFDHPIWIDQAKSMIAQESM